MTKEQVQKHKHPILWQCDQLNPNGDPYTTIRLAKGYYVYTERVGVDSVAFILIDKNKTRSVGLINEPKPPLGDDAFLTTAFGGSLDKDVPMNQIVQEEVKEESGFSVTLERISSLGRVMVSTQMNQFCYLFVVDVTDLEQGRRHLDETEFGSTVTWVKPKALLNLQDWKAPLIYMKYTAKD